MKLHICTHQERMGHGQRGEGCLWKASEGLRFPYSVSTKNICLCWTAHCPQQTPTIHNCQVATHHRPSSPTFPWLLSLPPCSPVLNAPSSRPALSLSRFSRNHPPQSPLTVAYTHPPSSSAQKSTCGHMAPKHKAGDWLFYGWHFVYSD